jgi:hypothetical protein
VALAGVLPAGASDLSTREISSARALYNRKCAKCHKFYHPADYSQEDWDMWMRKMAKKSKLKQAQTAELSRYLQTFRQSGGRAQTPPDQR